MNMKDLYTATPVARHADIRVEGNRVLLKDAAGALVEYLMGPDSELWLLPRPKADADITTLKADVAILKTDVAKVKEDLAKVVTATAIKP